VRDRLLAAGFPPAEISHSGTNLSDRGFGAPLRHPGVRLNLDLVSQVERLGRLAPGREIGLRLNPRAGAFPEPTRSAARGTRDPGRPAKSGIGAPPRAARPYPAAARQLSATCRSTRGAELLFQIITERDEHASIRIGTSLPFR
jgi:diaminopimelate decarboxylase